MVDWLARRADDRRERLALQCGEVRWTFGELDRRAGSTAARLRALGVQPEDRVALLMRNGEAYAELVHAIGRLRAVLVPLNVRLSPAEIAWQVDDVGARLLVYDEGLATLAAGVSCARLAWPPGRAGWDAAPDSPALAAPALVDLDAVHSVIYTSGTTGQPKGATLTWGNYWWSAVGSALNLGVHEGDRWLAVLPLFHVGGLSILLRCLIYGIPAIVHRSFDAAAANRAIDEDGVSIVSVVATMLQRMLDERGERPYPPSFRCALLGGGPAPRPLLEACARSGVPVVQTYGLTETASQVATLAPGDALRKLGSAGKPLLPTELRIERDDGSVAQPGEPGEIVVRGPTVSAGYVNQPETTAARIRDGWLHTGDVGMLDAEGYLYVLDRRDDLIISGGENVYPAEVEAVLLAHPDVAEAGVVGEPHHEWGMVPVAVIVPRAGRSPDEAALVAFCGQRLARYKVPRRIVMADRLPRTAAGKLRRGALRATIVDRCSGNA